MAEIELGASDVATSCPFSEITTVSTNWTPKVAGPFLVSYFRFVKLQLIKKQCPGSIALVFF